MKKIIQAIVFVAVVAAAVVEIMAVRERSIENERLLLQVVASQVRDVGIRDGIVQRVNANHGNIIRILDFINKKPVQ